MLKVIYIKPMKPSKNLDNILDVLFRVGIIITLIVILVLGKVIEDA
jgi:hypothetical protein